MAGGAKRAQAAPAPTGDERSEERRRSLLDAAAEVYARYGYAKTSMDEVARAAGISRQALYLHYAGKEALFQAAVGRLIERALGAARAALSDDKRGVGERLLGGFEAMHVHSIGEVSAEHLEELLAASSRLVGPQVVAADEDFAEEIAAALQEAGAPRRWAELGLSARELAAHLLAVSHGLKHRAGAAAYARGMRTAIRIVLRARLL